MSVFEVLIVVVFIILVVILALIASRNFAAFVKSGGTTFGGQEVRQADTHYLGKNLHDIRIKHGPSHVVGVPPDSLRKEHEKPTEIAGGTPAPKPWTEYKTWKALSKNKSALDRYWSDMNEVMQNLNLDWGGVLEELKDKLYDDREWAGRINIVDGRPKIVELVASPHRVGEGPLPKGAAAMVPAAIMEKLEAKPAMFIFHTHPGEDAGSVYPSAADLTGSMITGYTGRFAADLVISPYGVIMYRPSPKFRDEVWAHQRPRLAAMRKATDLLAAVSGMRSWNSPWGLEDFESVLRLYNVDYVVFPTDKYASMKYRKGYCSPEEVDTGQIQNLTSLIEELEKETAKEEVRSVPLEKSKGKLRKRVQFADPPEVETF